MGSRGEGAHRPTVRGASRSARTFTGGARRRPAPSSTFTLGGAKGSTPAPGVPGPVRTGGGGASTVCGVVRVAVLCGAWCGVVASSCFP